ncbi:MAG: Crp/Fnr family transcriptional regulator [Pleurocapsa sp.]
MNRQVEFFNTGDQLPTVLSYLWLIVDGVVKSYTVNQEGKTAILGFWGKQEVIGKSLSSVTPYFLQCMNDVQAIAIPSEQWDTISVNLLDRIQQIQQISYIIRNSQDDRLWLLLQWLARKFGDETLEGTTISFRLTEQELADALGMDRILVERILDRLEQENLISRLENQYILLRE